MSPGPSSSVESCSEDSEEEEQSGREPERPLLTQEQTGHKKKKAPRGSLPVCFTETDSKNTKHKIKHGMTKHESNGLTPAATL